MSMESTNEINERDKRKRIESSDMDTSKNEEPDQSEKLTKKQRKKLKAQVKKAKIQEEILTLDLSLSPKTREKEKSLTPCKNPEKKTSETRDTKSTEKADNLISVEKHLKEIKEILKNVITKDDPSFKRIIVETIKDMKEELLKSLTHKVDILEGELHEKRVENEQLRKDIEQLRREQINKTEFETVKADYNLKHLECLRHTSSLDTSVTKSCEKINDLEQYQRRNNLRISGLLDNPTENEENTITKICEKLNEHIPDLELEASHIDIAHRLGNFEPGNHRVVIVRFIFRTTRNKILANRACLKGTDIYVNEDLTKLNVNVLSSIRHKRKDEVEFAYTREGKIFVKLKDKSKVKLVKYEHFKYWLDLPWPSLKKPRKPKTTSSPESSEPMQKGIEETAQKSAS